MCTMLWLHLIRSTFPFIQLCPFFWERNWQLWHSCTVEEEPFFWTLSNPLSRQRGTQARNPHWTKLHFSRISSGDDLLTCLHFWPTVQWIFHKFWVSQNSGHYTKHKIVYFFTQFLKTKSFFSRSLLRSFSDHKRQTELHYIGWVKTITNGTRTDVITH